MRNPPALLAWLPALAMFAPLACSPVELRPETTAAKIRLDGRSLRVTLAARHAARHQWLQHLNPSSARRPWLLYYPEPTRPTFHALDLRFPARIAFLDADGRVIRIDRLRPQTDDRAASPEATRLVLAGTGATFRHHRVREGSRLEVPRRARQKAEAAWAKDREAWRRQCRDWGWPLPEEAPASSPTQ